jgi:hypothetical protein
MPHEDIITIQTLYPQMTEKELALAEANLRRFVAVLARIYEKDRTDLTIPSGEAMIPTERSKPNIDH